MDALRQVELFAHLTDSDLKGLEGVARRETHPAGRIVFFEGDRGDSLYVILRGLVKVYRTNEQGESKILRNLGAGEVFGELTLLDGKPRSATVETLEETEVLRLVHREFEAYGNANPGVLWGVMYALCQRVRKATEDNVTLAFEDVPFRILRALIQAMDERGHGVATDAVVLPVTPGDLGNMAGADRQGTARVLKMLTRRGLVEVEIDTVRIPNPAAVRRAIEYARDWF